VSLVGAKPIFADVDSSTFNVKLEQIESQISCCCVTWIPIVTIQQSGLNWGNIPSINLRLI
jgi:dTDP-4-amino-4,6-dideoxygalactose transaminase